MLFRSWTSSTIEFDALKYTFILLYGDMHTYIIYNDATTWYMSLPFLAILLFSPCLACLYIKHNVYIHGSIYPCMYKLMNIMGDG